MDPAWYDVDGVMQGAVRPPDRRYPQVLFNYIHENPVKAGLEMDPAAWEFSSAAAYAGRRQSILANMEAAAEYGLVYKW